MGFVQLEPPNVDEAQLLELGILIAVRHSL
jgi:hypothetical protein